MATIKLLRSNDSELHYRVQKQKLGRGKYITLYVQPLLYGTE